LACATITAHSANTTRRMALMGATVVPANRRRALGGAGQRPLRGERRARMAAPVAASTGVAGPDRLHI
jgi:hypothetical protein